MNADVVVDAGNSLIKWGRCSGGRVVETVALNPAEPDAWQSQLDTWHLKRRCQWAISGSDPARRDRVAKWLGTQNQHVFILNTHFQIPVTVNVEQPEKVGLDRLCNALAVNSRKPEGVAAVVIDAGTAVTVDYVDEAGVFQGGAILPGMWMMAELLHRHTAALPLVKPDDLIQMVASSRPPGKFTAQAMALGVAACLWGGIERIAREYLAFPGRAVFYFGGGDGPTLATGFSLGEHHLWPEMTLEGIRIAAEQLT